MKLIIDESNVAFDGEHNDELVRLLALAMVVLDSHSTALTGTREYIFRDINGNRCGLMQY